MVVDDSVLVCRALERALGAEGFEVVTRLNPIGTGAAIAREKPDVVLLDVSMPALDGGEVLATLAQARRRPRVLLPSDRDPAELEALARRHGADGTIPKGTPVAEIAQRLRRLVRAPQTRRRAVLVVEPEADRRARITDGLAGFADVTSSDSGTEALLLVMSPRPPELVVASTELDDLPLSKLAREAIRVDDSYRDRFVILRGPRGASFTRVEGFHPPMVDHDAAPSAIRDIVLSLEPAS